jgi:hypothetical protein
LGGALSAIGSIGGPPLAAARVARAAAGAAALLIACDAAAQGGRLGRFGDAEGARTERRIDCSAEARAGGGVGVEAEREVEAGGEAALPGDAVMSPCRVDVSTYVGWRVFQAYCATCHAADATGSTYAPDLTFRMRGMERRAFFAALDDGYFEPDAGIPPHGDNPDVARYYEELWAYLAARLSGDLPAGPLEPLPAASR